MPAKRCLVSAVLPFALLALGASSSSAAASRSRPFDDGKADFAVKVRHLYSPYRVLGIFVLPGEEVKVAVADSRGRDLYRIEYDGGTAERRGDAEWSWRLPAEKGRYGLRIVRERDGETVRINAFVMVPIAELRDGKLNGYLIGDYPEPALKGLEIYKPPRGFVEVTEENQDTPVAPHFTLGQFLCKQDGGYPRYVVLREKLLLKLELILQAVNDAGYRCDTLHVMSGYRTPYYNALIGNVRYSRHVWGGAADVFIDEEPVDGLMDDLNNDGRSDIADAAVLYDLIDALYGRPGYEPFLGGLGRYRKSKNHGPFVHVDVRGFRARWGT